MRKILFTLALMFAFALNSNAQTPFQINGPSEIYAGTYWAYSYSGGGITSEDWVVFTVYNANMEYTSKPSHHNTLLVKPHEGGTLSVGAENIYGSQAASLNVIVKPRDPEVSGDTYLTLVTYPTRTYVIGNHYVDILGVADDYEWDLSGPAGVATIFESPTSCRYVYSVAGTYTLRYRYKQNPIWSDWNTITITIN